MKQLARVALLVGTGAVLGGVITVWVTRASRIPGHPIYELRARSLGVVRDRSEANWLEQRYGPERQSFGPEEWIIRDYFDDRRGGVFVDVGSGDHRESNNTWYLETALGWSGVAVDALDQYREGFERHRPSTRFFNFFVSDRSANTARLFFGSKKGVSSSRQEFTAGYGPVQGFIEVPTVSLDDLLESAGIERFDFLSMDIELAEPKALAGLDLARFKPALVCVEAHPEVRQQIVDYFAERRYVTVGKYLRVDEMNLWFMPVGASVRPFPFHDELH